MQTNPIIHPIDAANTWLDRGRIHRQQSAVPMDCEMLSIQKPAETGSTKMAGWRKNPPFRRRVLFIG